MASRKRFISRMVYHILIIALLVPAIPLVLTGVEASTAIPTTTPEPVHYSGQYCSGNIPFPIELNEGDRLTMEIVAGLYNLGVQFKDPFGAVIWDQRIGHYNGQYVADTEGTYYVVIYKAYGLGCSTYEITYTIFPLQTHIWTVCTSGFFPQHLPDAYTGTVVLAELNLVYIPPQVQGVWWYDCTVFEWKFWVPGVGGDLTTLGGGHTYDYMVLVIGACDWEILLP